MALDLDDEGDLDDVLETVQEMRSNHGELALGPAIIFPSNQSMLEDEISELAPVGLRISDRP